MKNNTIRIISTVIVCLLAVGGIYLGTDYDKPELKHFENKKITKKSVEKAEVSSDANSEEASDDSSGFKDGNWQGSAKGYKGDVTVSVSVEQGKIQTIEVISHSDDAPYFTKAETIIPLIIEGQSLDVDTVTGATFSSIGLIEAVYNALEQGGNQ